MYEAHHICPAGKTFWPEFKNLNINKWNSIKLTPREHFIAHRLLAKTYGGGMWYALNMMTISPKQISREIKITSRVYQEIKNNLSKEASKNRKGSKISKEHKEKLSKVHTGTVCVKDNNGNMFRVKIDDPRYISGEVLYIWKNKKHSEETITKKRLVKYTEERRLKASENGKRPCSEEKKLKISKTLKGRKIPEQEGIGNPMTKIFKLTSPNYEEFYVTSADFGNFCNFKNLLESTVKGHKNKGLILAPLKPNPKREFLRNNCIGWECTLVGRLKQFPHIKLFSIPQI